MSYISSMLYLNGDEARMTLATEICNSLGSLTERAASVRDGSFGMALY